MSFKPRANSLGFEGYRDSGILDATMLRTLVLAGAGPDLDGIHHAIATRQLLVTPARDVAEAEELGYTPRYAVIDTSLPGALDFIRRISAPPREASVIALLAPGESESDALDAGAAATLSRPAPSSSVAKHLERFQRHEALLAGSRELFERDTANALVSTTSRIAAAIAHEIRNPLAAACLSIGWLIRTSDARTSEHVGALHDIELALLRIDGTALAIASLACGAAPDLELLSLFEIAKAALATIVGAQVELRGDRALEGLCAPKLLTQAIVNLVQNALDAIDDVPGGRVLVRVYATDNEARISIRDTGPGISSDLRERIFEPFFTTKGKRGSGLGLAIARAATARMGGALTLSTQGPGACFRIRLRKA